MNYLVVEGYKDAAEQFSSESGLAPTVDLQSIQERMDIRHAIQSGDVDTAIDLVNDLNPEVKEENIPIHTYTYTRTHRFITVNCISDPGYKPSLIFSPSTTTPN